MAKCVHTVPGEGVLNLNSLYFSKSMTYVEEAGGTGGVGGFGNTEKAKEDPALGKVPFQEMLSGYFNQPKELF